jgi:hypothetical protein
MHEYLERCEFILPLFHCRWNGGQRLRSSGCPQVLYSVVNVPNERSIPVQRSTAAQLPPTTNEPTLPIRLPKQAKTRPRHPDSNNTEQPSHHIISQNKAANTTRLHGSTEIPKRRAKTVEAPKDLMWRRRKRTLQHSLLVV